MVFQPSAEYHSSMKPQRPLVLTFLCVMGFVAGFSGMFLVYSPSVIQAGKVYALFRSFSFAFLVVCFGGLWKMRRWAVWGLGAYFLANQAVCWYCGLWDKGTLGPLLIVAVAAAYYRRMA